MFISIVGTSCSGKTEVLKHLKTQGFNEVRLSVPEDSPESFATPSAMLDHVTKNWLSNWVTLSLTKKEDLEMFSKRPFFLLLNVDGPVMLRWRRYCER